MLSCRPKGDKMSSDHKVSRLRPDGGYGERFAPGAEVPAEGLVEELDNVMRLLQQPGFPPRCEEKDRSASELDAALEMVKRAAEAMSLMEERSRLVQTRAEALAEQARHDAALANERAASLQRRVVVSEARAEELDTKLQEAEERARAANEWLIRFYDTIMGHFSTRRPAPAPALRAAA
jgi:hypothetical protein